MMITTPSVKDMAATDLSRGASGLLHQTEAPPQPGVKASDENPLHSSGNTSSSSSLRVAATRPMRNDRLYRS